eukprot:TRINITY_DN14613_c0_g1_i1.p1 TRINITY_DN14613_c0_g1~~TRINITY_DN14613_c0_g1_i1.p1  ORF type:complete len:288 (-),score=74.27 TRINITY_DN14613_c0_g1_i1:1015-1851(-)
MSTKPPPNPLQHSVLTSDVINEVEQTFKSKATDGLVSQMDMILLIRSMGMNPTDSDLDQLFDAMQIRDPERERQERIERDERERKEKERREKEKAELEAAGDDKKAKREAQRKAASAAVKKRGKEEEKKDTFVWIPPERRPMVDWTSFITHVEPFYKDNKIEEEEIMRAFKVFDREGRGWIGKDELIKILTQKGEDILAPQEVTILSEMFSHSRVDFREFAQKMQGTWVEPKVEEPEMAMSTTSSRQRGAVSARREDGSSNASATGSVAGSTTPSSAK